MILLPAESALNLCSSRSSAATRAKCSASTGDFSPADGATQELKPGFAANPLHIKQLACDPKRHRTCSLHSADSAICRTAKGKTAHSIPGGKRWET